MRIATTVFAAIALIGASLAPALAQNPPGNLPPCRTPAVDAEIQRLTAEIGGLQQQANALDSQSRDAAARITQIANTPNGRSTPEFKEANSDWQKLLDRSVAVNKSLSADKTRLAALKALPPCGQPGPATTPATAVSPAPAPAAQTCRDPAAEAKLQRQIDDLHEDKRSKYNSAIDADRAALSRQSDKMGLSDDIHKAKSPEEVARVQEIALKDPVYRALQDQLTKDLALQDNIDSEPDILKLNQQLKALTQLPPCPKNPSPVDVTPPKQPVAPLPPGTPPGMIAPTPGVKVAYYNSPLEAWFYNAPYYNSPFEAWFYNTPYNTPVTPSVWDGFYIGVGGGASFVPTVTATEFFNDGKDRFPWGSDTGSYFGAQAGLQFGNWRAEGQYTWSRNPAAATMPLPTDFKIGGDTEAFGFFGNAIYTPPFVLGIPVTPHVGVGFGALNVTTKVKFNDMTVFNSSGWAPGVQAIGGLTYQISPRLSLDLDYRYQTTLTDVDYRALPIAGSDIRNRVTAPYAAHYITLGLNLHFPVASPPPAPATPAPVPRSALPQAQQVALLAPTDTAPAAAHRVTLHYDEANAALTRASVRSLHDALDAIEAGQIVQIAIAGCETDADYADGSPCARHALRLRHLLARYGVANPGHFLVRG